MRIECYHFFFHPLHKNFSNLTKVTSLVVSIALTIFSAGIYAVIFAFVRYHEVPQPEVSLQSAEKTNKSVLPMRDFGSFVGIETLKAKQKIHLDKLKGLAHTGQWRHLQTHTEHPDSGFDWWMFPIDRSSSLGNLYRVSNEVIEKLKNDPEFMANYREGVELVAHSWGWDLVMLKDLSGPTLHWAGLNVRLGKMLHSLSLFGQEDLKKALTYFIELKRMKTNLDPWILNYIK